MTLLHLQLVNQRWTFYVHSSRLYTPSGQSTLQLLTPSTSLLTLKLLPTVRSTYSAFYVQCVIRTVRYTYSALYVQCVIRTVRSTYILLTINTSCFVKHSHFISLLQLVWRIGKYIFNWKIFKKTPPPVSLQFPEILDWTTFLADLYLILMLQPTRNIGIPCRVCISSVRAFPPRIQRYSHAGQSIQHRLSDRASNT